MSTIDPIITETFKLVLEYEMKINTSTGELIETKLIKRSVDKANFQMVESKPKRSKKVVKEETTDPILTLEDNKYFLNTAAIDLMQVIAEDKLDIKYEKIGKNIIPVIGTDTVFGTKSGCKLTKSNSVSCRGSKNEALSKYGKEFIIKPHPTKVGLFILTGDTIESEVDEDVNLDNLDEELPLVDNLEDISEDVTEIDSSFFTFN